MGIKRINCEVELPIVGTVYHEFEMMVSEDLTKSQLREVILEEAYNKECTDDKLEYEVVDSIVTGNVLHAPLNEPSVEYSDHEKPVENLKTVDLAGNVDKKEE